VILAIASGKGGTGKTTVATNLAWVAAQYGVRTAYLDCDVEEPNGHIFLKPKITSKKPVGIPVPKADEGKCTHCGECAKVCRYSAIVCVKDTVVVNGSMCHGCGGCAMVCPAGAITEESRAIGVVERGTSEAIEFVRGELTVGVAISPPLIRAVKELCPPADLAVFDSPPGTSCPVVETVRESDLVILVTEPTPFGLHDLKLAVDLVHELKLPLGVVINRFTLGTDELETYCRETNLPVLGRIPDDRKIAEAYSKGLLIAQVLSDYRWNFKTILDRIREVRGR